MLEKFKFSPKDANAHVSTSNMKISICVRKRPIFQKEETSGEIDAVSVANPKVRVHECKYRVDGITKYVDNQDFIFDNAFSHNESNDDLYKATI